MICKRRAILPVMVLAVALALPACQAEKKPASQRAAGGEVLPGSVSDAMLPLDTLRSQPPLAPRPTASARTAGSKAEPGESDAAQTGAEASADAGAGEPETPQ